MVKKSSILDIESERYSIAGILKNIKVLGELPRNFSENIYSSRLYGTCFSAIQEAVKDGEDVNPYLIATKIGNLGISFDELSGGTLLEHLEEIKNGISLTEQATLDFIKRLCKISLLREREAAANKVASFVKEKSNWELPAEDIINFTDEAFQGNLSLYTREGAEEFNFIFEIAERMMEERAANPITEFGYFGPFEKYNYLYDALYTPGDINATASRSNVGKTSFGFFQSAYVCERYKVPLLWMDGGEMTSTQMIMRAICSFSKGKIPTYYIKTGLWKQEPEMVAIFNQIKPRIENLKKYFAFRNIGGLNSAEICSTIRRFWLSKVGRLANDLPSFGSDLGPLFPVTYDYLKPMNGDNLHTPEWATMGYHLQDLKNLITQEVPAGINTFLQLNKTGITRGKSAGQYDDSEGSWGMSDRIYHNVSRGESLRFKTLDELAEENQQFGNCVLKNVKRRDLGKGFKEALTPVRMPDGSLRDNHIHLNQDSFFWEEKGTLTESVQAQDMVSDDDYEDGDVELK